MSLYVIPGIQRLTSKTLRGSDIVRIVSKHYTTDAMGLIKKQRKTNEVLARQMCMYMLRKHTRLTLEDIGLTLHRNHATVIHGINKIKGFIKIEDSFILDDIRAIEMELK